MLRLTELRLPLDHPPEALREAVLHRLTLPDNELLGLTVFRRGYDARKPQAIMLVYTLDLTVANEARVLARNARDRNLGPAPDTRHRFPAQAPPNAPRPVVIGTGPCGFMAALALAQMGFRPLVLERGPMVRPRTKATWGLWRRGVLEPEANVQFGEGGAGTFSDGKLYSGVKDPRFHGRKLLAEFVKAGAPEEILYVSKPHVGTFRLVTMVENIRAEIERLGGEYRFDTRVEDVLIEDGVMRGLVLAGGEEVEATQVVLAIGHSARDTFAMLHRRGVYMEAKPFSIGVRIEHPQAVIDAARFGPNAGNRLLGAADYKLVHHARNGRAVYSFCMCPGGRVVAATSEVGQVVTNGMSQYSRAEFNANAGLVVGVTPEDYPGDVLAGVDFQRALERRAYDLGGGGYLAPAQRVADFLEGRASVSLGGVEPSYKPGVTPTDLALLLPDWATAAMREALRSFGAELKGYAMGDAVLTGVETRTSAPIRIRRNEQFESINVKGLYPAGEGAGYAGGIFSAGVDGMRAAEAVALHARGEDVPKGWARGSSELVYG